MRHLSAVSELHTPRNVIQKWPFASINVKHIKGIGEAFQIDSILLPRKNSSSHWGARLKSAPLELREGTTAPSSGYGNTTSVSVARGRSCQLPLIATLIVPSWGSSKGSDTRPHSRGCYPLPLPPSLGPDLGSVPASIPQIAS